MTSTNTSPKITFVTRGPVDAAARDAAQDEFERIIATAPRPVIFARVKLTVEEQRPHPEQAIAQGTLDVSGALIRAEASGATASQAVDRLADRLDRQLRRLAERREDSRDRPPETPAGEWRSGDLATSRPGFYPRPVEEREIVRHKARVPKAVSVEEAVFDLELLDHRFLLFTDHADGVESVVYEQGSGVRLQRLDGGDLPVEREVPVTVNPAPAPVLSVDQAVARLGASDEPFVFFRDAETGRAAVLYRRYDGHYGLITPR